MRARLDQMKRSEELRCICDADVAGRMDRVITYAGGVVKQKKITENGTEILIMKAE